MLEGGLGQGWAPCSLWVGLEKMRGTPLCGPNPSLTLVLSCPQALQRPAGLLGKRSGTL